MYEHLVLQLSLRWRREAGGAARELLDGMLQLGPNEAEYTQLLDDMGDALPLAVGTTDFDALMELAEVILSHASPNPDARRRLWARIVAALSPVRMRLTRREIGLINDLGQVFDIDEVFPVSAAASEELSTGPNPLAGKMVTIYTLMDTAADRARRMLIELYPGIRVQLSHDLVGSSQLAGMARRSDVFVVCWRSASHAATQTIEHLRPPDAATLYPPGKGSSSILRAIEEYLAT